LPRAVFALLTLLLCIPARAGSGVWTGQALTKDLAPDKRRSTLLWLDLHERQTGETFNAIVRPGVGVKLLPTLTLWTGYAWIPTVGDAVSHENRLWQQAIGTGTLGEMKLMGRLHFEQRFLEGASNIGLRLRTFGRIGVPIQGPVGLSLWDEAFIRLNENAGNSEAFDQNRTFAGFYHQAPGIRVEMGYLNLLRGKDPTVDHLAAAYVFLSPKCKPKPPPTVERAAERSRPSAVVFSKLLWSDSTHGYGPGSQDYFV
jgi:hypothetical protein